MSFQKTGGQTGGLKNDLTRIGITFFLFNIFQICFLHHILDILSFKMIYMIVKIDKDFILLWQLKRRPVWVANFFADLIISKRTHSEQLCRQFYNVEIRCGNCGGGGSK